MGSLAWSNAYTLFDEQYLGIERRFSLVEVEDHQYHRTHQGDLFDRKNGDIYKYENPNILVQKFVMNLLALPLYTAVKSLYHAAALPYTIGETALQGAYGHFSLNEQLGKLHHHSVEILRCGEYFCGISLALVRGIALTIFSNPLYAHETRTLVSHLEKEWSHDVPRNKDFRYYVEHKDITRVDYYYLAFCFLPHGKLEATLPDSDEPRFTLRQQQLLEV